MLIQSYPSFLMCPFSLSITFKFHHKNATIKSDFIYRASLLSIFFLNCPCIYQLVNEYCFVNILSVLYNFINKQDPLHVSTSRGLQALVASEELVGMHSMLRLRVQILANFQTTKYLFHQWQSIHFVKLKDTRCIYYGFGTNDKL